MAQTSQFEPEYSNLPSTPAIYHFEESSEEDAELVTAFFADPVGALNREFPGQGFESRDDWTVHTQVIDHHLFYWGWIWTMTAVVVPDRKQIVVTAIKHPRPTAST